MSEHIQFEHPELENFDGQAIHKGFVDLSRDMPNRKAGGGRISGRHLQAHVEYISYGSRNTDEKELEAGGQMELAETNQ